MNHSLFQDDAYIHDHPFGFNQIENLWEISPPSSLKNLTEAKEYDLAFYYISKVYKYV